MDNSTIKFFNYSLYSYFDPHEGKVHCGSGQVRAQNESDARAEIMEKEWPWEEGEAPCNPHLVLFEVPVSRDHHGMHPGAVYLHDDGNSKARLVRLNHLYLDVAYCNAPDFPTERLQAKHLHLMVFPLDEASISYSEALAKFRSLGTSAYINPCATNTQL